MFLKRSLPAFAVSLLSLAAWVRGDSFAPGLTEDEQAALLPQPLNMELFEGLIANPPFTRSVNLSDSVILTGVAVIDGEYVATLLNTQTMQSQVVTPLPNAEGWQLVGLGGDAAVCHTWNAKIQVAGGEVISVRYQTPPAKTNRSSSGGGSSGGSSGSGSLSSSQLAEAKKAAENYREGFSADGYPRQPPPEMVAKLSRLSTSQREAINRQMLGYRNQGLGLDERRKIYEGLVDRSLQTRR
jgi:hypothetical protein